MRCGVEPAATRARARQIDWLGIGFLLAMLIFGIV